MAPETTSSISVRAIDEGIEPRTGNAPASLSRTESEQLIAFLKKVISDEYGENAFNDDNNEYCRLEITDHLDYIELILISDNLAEITVMPLDKDKIPQLLDQVNQALVDSLRA